MGLELLTVAKEWGLGAVGVILGVMNWIIGTGKLNKSIYYTNREKDREDLTEYKNDIRMSLEQGNLKFKEIEGNQKCLPDIQSDLKRVLQELAGIRAVMEMKKG